MKKKLLLAGIPVAALTLLGASLASAHGFGFGFMNNLTPQQIAQNQQDHFQQQADLLGISVNDVKAAWAKGETLEQLATEHGISSDQLKTKLKEQMQSKMKQRLQSLVDQGVITQDQMNQRLQFMQTKMNNAGQKGMFRGHGHMMMGL